MKIILKSCVLVCVWVCANAQAIEEHGCSGAPVVNCNCGYEIGQKGSESQFQNIGRAGKQGAKGDKGEIGMKGEPGSTEALLSQLQHLKTELLSIKDNLKWYTAQNGYQYRITPARQSWNQSRVVCQNMGSDLAVVGARDYETRLEVARVLLKPRSIGHTWMGLTDAQEEGVWMWLDGTEATETSVHWNPGQPDNNSGIQHCGLIWYERYEYRSDDGHCNASIFALCERLLDQS